MGLGGRGQLFIGRGGEEENNNSARFLQAIGGDDEGSFTKACQEYIGEQLDDVCVWSVCLCHNCMMRWVWFCVWVTIRRIWSRWSNHSHQYK